MSLVRYKLDFYIPEDGILQVLHILKFVITTVLTKMKGTYFNFRITLNI
jgi:hypothetical protein